MARAAGGWPAFKIAGFNLIAMTIGAASVKGLS